MNVGFTCVVGECWFQVTVIQFTIHSWFHVRGCGMHDETLRHMCASMRFGIDVAWRGLEVEAGERVAPDRAARGADDEDDGDDDDDACDRKLQGALQAVLGASPQVHAGGLLKRRVF